jgi:hypothetical protein
MLLYDQSNNMMQVNIDKEEILELLEEIYSKAAAMTVQKEQSQKLQKEIVDNYENYRQAIERIYSNAEEKY